MGMRILIIPFILLLISVAVTGCVQKEKVERAEKAEFEAPAKVEKPKAEPIDGNCLACHYNERRQYVPQADRIPGHLNASDFCIYCHVKNATELSEREIFEAIHPVHAKSRDCSECHRTYTRDELRCGNCHAGEDMLEPSNGNVFEIHSPRGVGCEDCHGRDMIRIHIEGKKFPEYFSLG